jgi:probable F420-dependent oxidoreductase
MTLSVGVFVTHANELVGPDLSRLTEVAQVLDEGGIDYLVVADHVVLATQPSGHEALGGALGYPADEPYPDPLLVLASIAATTTRIRLATGILIVPLRPAVLLAKMVATLATLCRGRLDLGVGTGWQVEEFDALGVPIEGKAKRLDESLAACRVLWRGGPAAFHGDTVDFDGVCCAPTPPGGDVPLWFAGTSGAATLARVARTGAGWLPIRRPADDELRAASDTLQKLAAEAGRADETIGIRVPLPVTDDLDSAMRAAAANGATGVHVPLRQLAGTVEELEAAVLRLRDLAAA